MTSLAIWFGVAVGCALGLLGGGIGTYVSFKAAKSPAERRFVLGGSVAWIIFIVAYVVGLAFLSQPARLYATCIFVLINTLAIRFWNRRSEAFRRATGEAAAEK